KILSKQTHFFMDTYLPPKYSMNAFFVRHVAHPRRMKYISGLNNAKICAVNDIGYVNQPSSSDPVNFPPNNFNDQIIKSNGAKRKEKAIPPNGPWRTFGLIDNTDKWRSELNSLASSVGLLTQNDLEEHKNKKDREQMIKNIQKQNPTSSQSRKPTSQQQQHQQQSHSSGRLNEPLLTGRRTKGSRGSRGMPLTGNNYIVDQADREAWMLQVLCQILQTESLVDVQSWLVSTSDAEKERVKQLINQAMKGLEESGRINTIAEEASGAENAIKDIEGTLQRISFSRQERLNTAKKSTTLPLLMKSDDENVKKKLDAIPEILKIDQVDHEPSSQVFNINFNKSDRQSSLENAVIKLETPRSNDVKVEKVKVTMLVKDENSNSLQEVTGDWQQ
ncbi:TBATA isoform X1, partial [Brachionus plicatilis]